MRSMYREPARVVETPSPKIDTSPTPEEYAEKMHRRDHRIERLKVMGVAIGIGTLVIVLAAILIALSIDYDRRAADCRAKGGLIVNRECIKVERIPVK